MENKELEIFNILLNEKLNVKDAIKKANQLIKSEKMKESDKDE